MQIAKNIVLLGIKHSGKSTLGEILAKHYCLCFFDTDSVIEDMTGKTARYIYSQKGKDAFMAQEAKACYKIWQAPAPCVVATGGGVCQNNAALEIIKQNSILVFLDIKEDVAFKRIIKEAQKQKDGTFSNLPAFISNKAPKTIDDIKAIFKDFYKTRVALYKQIATICVPVTETTKEKNCLCVIQELQKL